ncbi:hypothetical protein C9J85_18840 [Haloferax sp. wsp5]|nr:hypothetical protein C9J85_18840 [Haloferax sp. wsp5]
MIQTATDSTKTSTAMALSTSSTSTHCLVIWNRQQPVPTGARMITRVTTARCRGIQWLFVATRSTPSNALWRCTSSDAYERNVAPTDPRVAAPTGIL